jgi:hypothetical protein
MRMTLLTPLLAMTDLLRSYESRLTR